MFDGIKRFIREARIKADFPRYEKSRLEAHVATAERQFDTTQLEREVVRIKETACRAANDKFDKETSALHQEIAILAQDIRRIQDLLAIFERNYKEELDELYVQKTILLEEKARLIEEMQHLQRERSGEQDSLDDAYRRLESERDSIDRWYRRSERTQWLLGNGGKKLPKHSLFRQSFGDLDAHKSQRGHAVSDIGDCKNGISRIKDRQKDNKERRQKDKVALNYIVEQIEATKAARGQMFKLKQQGIKPSALKKELSEHRSYHADRNKCITALNTKRAAFIEAMECQLGIKERGAEIAALRARKVGFLDEFNAFTNQERRRADHRKEWMSGHGRHPQIPDDTN